MADLLDINGASVQAKLEGRDCSINYVFVVIAIIHTGTGCMSLTNINVNNRHKKIRSD